MKYYSGIAENEAVVPPTYAAHQAWLEKAKNRSSLLAALQQASNLIHECDKVQFTQQHQQVRQHNNETEAQVQVQMQVQDSHPEQPLPISDNLDDIPALVSRNFVVADETSQGQGQDQYQEMPAYSDTVNSNYSQLAHESTADIQDQTQYNDEKLYGAGAEAVVSKSS
jgi:hypothetical protein